MLNLAVKPNVYCFGFFLWYFQAFGEFLNCIEGLEGGSSSCCGDTNALQTGKLQQNGHMYSMGFRLL